ncbi:hypothetical protein ACQR1K_24765 [Bradyrhizobium sp. HKCCYLRH3095]|uniref:hypothetical protein n=1 Tax=Bradyrhizobium sp. HKCCYLRH3095 TaxID=3420765 RepID=UPI003EBA3D8D
MNKSADLKAEEVETFWRIVVRCLRDVFGKSDWDASQLVSDMKSKMKGLTEEARLLVYHDAPIQVAANLAGVAHRPLGDREVLEYEELLKQEYPEALTEDNIPPNSSELLEGYFRRPRFD